MCAAYAPFSWSWIRVCLREIDAERDGDARPLAEALLAERRVRLAHKDAGRAIRVVRLRHAPAAAEQRARRAAQRREHAEQHESDPAGVRHRLRQRQHLRERDKSPCHSEMKSQASAWNANPGME